MKKYTFFRGNVAFFTLPPLIFRSNSVKFSHDGAVIRVAGKKKIS
ncbi:hypothetical protein HMPREF9162_1306 [Selenomonas sp. oral taxon 137 str. F0430]|nr:hypothetical protein HMPREF9162_1306 [Selenomonas sp. oral taxon 137 str. F0430]EJP32154.1 hypothetical protein HMPREF1147_2277 [Selenomonas sp. FOBRC9]